MRPYYENGGITIYHGDCRVILPDLALEPALVLTDPPYGFGVDTAYHSRGRGKPSAKSTHVGKSRIARANEYEPVAGDDEPFDPTHLLRYATRTVLWGANHYADRLPGSPSWLVWDRVSGGSATADAELAWTNLGGTIRTFTYRWNGACRHGEKDTHGFHPTQKPVALMRWVLERATDHGDLVLDPYMGSGPVAKACQELGRRYVGVELVEHYCEIAAERLSQEVLDFGAAA